MTATAATITATPAEHRTRIESHRRMIQQCVVILERLHDEISTQQCIITGYQQSIREEERELRTLEYIHTTGHVPAKHTTPTCSGCRADSTLDCLYESLTYCTRCGGLEGALLPTCPGRSLTYDEHQANYEQYCAGTGPFAGRGR